VGVPHDVKGSALYAFVTLTRGAGAQSRDGCNAIVAGATASPRLAEAALVGVPHDVEGAALYAFVTLTQDAETRPVVEIGSISTRPPAGASRRASTRSRCASASARSWSRSGPGHC